jgi:holo-[acyl-carrier protein] synthase
MRFFTPQEVEYFKSKGGKAETLAGFFCAKEAVAKAFGTGIRGFRLTDIEITHDKLGAPIIVLHNEAKKLADGKKVNVSISHDKDYAVAIAIMV